MTSSMPDVIYLESENDLEDLDFASLYEILSELDTIGDINEL